MYIFRKLVSLIVLATSIPLWGAECMTLEECVRKAQENYPLIKKYGLLDATQEIELSDISKAWLPRLTLYGQVTIQNAVPQFPEALKGVLQQMGQSMSGLGHVQYKAGLDATQSVWDGGVTSAQRELTRKQIMVQKATLDVELYAVRQRVENIYFAALLSEQQIEQNLITLTLLESNHKRLCTMLRNGTAMQSDVDMLEAQQLTLKQGISLARTTVRGYKELLGLFTGEDISEKKLEMPTACRPKDMQSDRPELQLFEQKIAFNDALQRLSDTSLMPRISLFAQAYYGYPGIDYFRSMRERTPNFNILAGFRATWSLDSFYTRKNSTRKHQNKLEEIESDRELFLFNTELQSSSQNEAIAGLKEVIEEDSKIVELRVRIRKAAESQLANGIIDTTALLSKICDENVARLTSILHQIQLQQEIYKLKYTLNR